MYLVIIWESCEVCINKLSFKACLVFLAMSGLLWSLVWFLSHEVAYSQNVWLMCEQDQQLRVWFVCGDLAQVATVSMLYTPGWCILQCILGAQSMPQRLASRLVFKLYLERISVLRHWVFSQQCNCWIELCWIFSLNLHFLKTGAEARVKRFI